MPSPVTPARPAAHTWIASLALVAGTVLLFSRSFGYGFINYDDPIYVTDNARVQAGLTWPGIVWAFTGHSDYWHPLTWLSHMLDWQLFGPHATGHRAVSVAWHAANTVLVFTLFRRLTGAWWASLFGAALFAWHPLRVESVIWVTERKDVMSGFFFLLTLLVYTGYAHDRCENRPSPKKYWLALGLFLAGLMCKPSLVTVPLLLLVLDFGPFQAAGRRPVAGVLREKIPFLLLSAGVGIATVLMQQHVGAFVLELTVNDRIGNALVSIVRYLGKFFWPVDLVICYPHPGTWPLPVVLGAAALITGLSLAAWYRRAAQPWLLAGWRWYLVMLLPSLGLLQVGFQAMADRFTYLAILGLQLALLPLTRALPGPVAVRGSVAVAALAAAAALSWHQQVYWRDSATLYAHALEVDGRNGFAAGFLAYTYMEEGRSAEAETVARRTIELMPRNEWGWRALAGAQQQTGRRAEAAETYRQLLLFDPTHLEACGARARLLAQLGRLAEASEELARATTLAPDDVGLWISHAELLARQRRFGEAAAAYESALALDPGNAAAHAGLGYMLALTGRHTEAAMHWREALRLQPDFPGLRERLDRLEPAAAGK